MRTSGRIAPEETFGSMRFANFTLFLYERVIAISGQSLPIFDSGCLEFSYFGKDLDEADGEPEEVFAGMAVWE